MKLYIKVTHQSVFKCGDGLLTTGGREGAVGSLILTMNAL